MSCETTEFYYRIVQYSSSFYKVQRLRNPYNGPMKDIDFYYPEGALIVARAKNASHIDWLRRMIEKYERSINILENKQQNEKYNKYNRRILQYILK